MHALAGEFNRTAEVLFAAEPLDTRGSVHAARGDWLASIASGSRARSRAGLKETRPGEGQRAPPPPAGRLDQLTTSQWTEADTGKEGARDSSPSPLSEARPGLPEPDQPMNRPLVAPGNAKTKKLSRLVVSFGSTNPNVPLAFEAPATARSALLLLPWS